MVTIFIFDLMNVCYIILIHQRLLTLLQTINLYYTRIHIAGPGHVFIPEANAQDTHFIYINYYFIIFMFYIIYYLYLLYIYI